MPSGEPLYRIARDTLKAAGMWQLRLFAQAGWLRKEIDPEYADPGFSARYMAGRFIPYIDAYIETGGTVARTELGLQNADDWLIRNPYAIEAARTATLSLCEETVSNFLGNLDDTLNGIRRDIAQSIDQGETTGETINRVARWIDDDARWRARGIAVTESARAFNAGFIASTEDLDFIAGYALELSSDACPLCHAIKRICPMIPKGGTFGQNGKNPKYANLKMAPFHTRCRCSLVTIFDDEVPESWPKPAKPGANGYIQPTEADIMASTAGGYESVAIGNAKSVSGFILPWEG